MNTYLNTLLESEEIQFYLRNFGKGLKKNLTVEKIKKLTNLELQNEYNKVLNKTSNLSKKERDLIVYFAEKELKNRI
jgi:hypothetical protein